MAGSGVNRPFLLLTGSEETERNDPSLGSFLAASTSPNPSPRFPDISSEP